MIDHSVSYGVYNKLIGIYRNSVVVKTTSKIFDFMGKTFMNSKFVKLFTSDNIKSSIFKNGIMKFDLSGIGSAYQNSLIYKFVSIIENFVVNIFKNSILFNFFVEKGCDEDQTLL